jgi:tRNA uridine 5-carboxymethylaminomethyl modification enzyme
MLSEIDKDRPYLPYRVILTVETDIKYAGYAQKQLAEVERRRRLDTKLLPDGLDYSKVTGLRLEAAQKLASIRPRTIGQASRISGVNPADITVLLIYLGLK